MHQTKVREASIIRFADEPENDVLVKAGLDGRNLNILWIRLYLQNIVWGYSGIIKSSLGLERNEIEIPSELTDELSKLDKLDIKSRPWRLSQLTTLLALAAFTPT